MDDAVKLPRLYRDPDTGLVSPRSYLVAPPGQRAEVCNGAGPKGKGWTVPDTMYGLSVTEACNIHDWMYHKGATAFDKVVADLVLLINLVLTILTANVARGWIKTSPVTWWRLKRAMVYFLCVWWHGDGPYWAGKQRTG